MLCFLECFLFILEDAERIALAIVPVATFAFIAWMAASVAAARPEPPGTALTERAILALFAAFTFADL